MRLQRFMQVIWKRLSIFRNILHFQIALSEGAYAEICWNIWTHAFTKHNGNEVDCEKVEGFPYHKLLEVVLEIGVDLGVKRSAPLPRLRKPTISRLQEESQEWSERDATKNAIRSGLNPTRSVRVRFGVEECEMELKCLSGAATRMIGGGFRHIWWRCEGGVDCVRGCQSGEKRGKEEDDRTEESSSMRGDSTRWARLLAHINGGESAVIMDGCDQSTFPWWHVYRLERGGLSTSWPMDSLELFLAVGFVPWSNGPCGVFA